MKTSYLILGALGVGAVLLLTTDKGKKLTKDLADNAGDWTKRVNKLVRSASDELSSLKDLVSNEIEGLSEEAREKIAAILDEGATAGKSLKKTAAKQLS